METPRLPLPLRSLLVVLLAVVASGSTAQQPETYVAVRTEHGQPDLQGTWVASFLTMLERPPGVERLVVDDEQAEAVAEQIWGRFPSVLDPDITLLDVRQLARVRGELRTSIIVDPPDGHFPYTEAGLELAQRVMASQRHQFDDPEQRPLPERCLESLGAPPMRVVPSIIPLRIHQTRDHLLLLFEDPVGLRLVDLRSDAPPAAIRSVSGHGRGRFEGETLVVTTTHLLAAYPARFGLGRPVLLSPATEIVERFTRVSETEIVYRFTVSDPQLYSESWSGEFSLSRFDQPMYEYACHEANYSLPYSLRGGQAEADRLAAERDPG